MKQLSAAHVITSLLLDKICPPLRISTRLNTNYILLIDLMEGVIYFTLVNGDDYHFITNIQT